VLDGLLIEPQRTNMVLYSADFTSSTVWTRTGSPTITNNSAGAPDGTSSFNLLSRTSTVATYIKQTISKSASSLSYVLTTYAKKGSAGNYLTIRLQGTYPARTDCIFDLNAGTVGAISNTGAFNGFAGIVNVGGGVYRCTLGTTSTDSATSISAVLSPNSVSGSQVDWADTVANSNVYIWGAQLEQAASATSYTPTGAAIVTRAADALSFTVPGGVSSLTYRFDDGSTQKITVSPGAYTVPTSLNRANIISIRSQ
jgi:hypothetical protein